MTHLPKAAELFLYRLSYDLIGREHKNIGYYNQYVAGVDVEDVISQLRSNILGTEMNFFCDAHNTTHYEVVEDVMIVSVRRVANILAFTDKAIALINKVEAEPDLDAEEPVKPTDE